MSHDFQRDIDAVGRIASVPSILDVVCFTTGMGFAAVARVTEDRWIACNVRDDIAFGLKPGSELEVASTICSEIRDSRRAIAIDNVAEDKEFCQHPTPRIYGFQSYISTPIILDGDRFFGTLCAIDPKPTHVKNVGTLGMFTLFSELIALRLDAIGVFDEPGVRWLGGGESEEALFGENVDLRAVLDRLEESGRGGVKLSDHSSRVLGRALRDRIIELEGVIAQREAQFRVIVGLSSDHVAEIIASATTRALADAIFREAVARYPGMKIRLFDASSVIAEAGGVL